MIGFNVLSWNESKMFSDNQFYLVICFSIRYSTAFVLNNFFFFNDSWFTNRKFTHLNGTNFRTIISTQICLICRFYHTSLSFINLNKNVVYQWKLLSIFGNQNCYINYFLYLTLYLSRSIHTNKILFIKITHNQHTRTWHYFAWSLFIFLVKFLWKNIDLNQKTHSLQTVAFHFEYISYPAHWTPISTILK